MKNKNKKPNDQIKFIKQSFTGGNITKYSGINVISKYLKRQKLGKYLGQLFPTVYYNATKFSVVQTLL